MDIRRTGDIPGLVSCGIFALVAFGCGALAAWGYFSGPGGHPSNDVIAFFMIIWACTFVPPVGAVIGLAGLAMRHKRDRTLSAMPSLVGSAANAIVFAGGAYFYLRYFIFYP